MKERLQSLQNLQKNVLMLDFLVDTVTGFLYPFKGYQLG